MSEPYKGQCLCGAVKYEADAFGPKMGHCHCSMCRKFHGAPFVTLGEVKKSEFRWMQGEDQLRGYEAPNGTIRRFCGQCGSSMTFYTPNAPDDMVEVALGTLDSDIDSRPDAHIFVGSKSNWTSISDGLPQYSQGRSSEQVNRG